MKIADLAQRLLNLSEHKTVNFGLKINEPPQLFILLKHKDHNSLNMNFRHFRLLYDKKIAVSPHYSLFLSPQKTKTAFLSLQEVF